MRSARFRSGKSGSKRRDAGAGGFEAFGGLEEGALVLDIGHVEGIGALHGEDIGDIRGIQITAPAEFLDNHVLRRGDPVAAVEDGYGNFLFSPGLLDHKGGIEKLEEFGFYGRRRDGLSDMAFTPSESVEGGLLLEYDDVLARARSIFSR